MHSIVAALALATVCGLASRGHNSQATIKKATRGKGNVVVIMRDVADDLLSERAGS